MMILLQLIGVVMLGAWMSTWSDPPPEPPKPKRKTFTFKD
jgi:hypothetical protein